MVKTFYMSKMNLAYSVQPPYIAGHSLYDRFTTVPKCGCGRTEFVYIPNNG